MSPGHLIDPGKLTRQNVITRHAFILAALLLRHRVTIDDRESRPCVTNIDFPQHLWWIALPVVRQLDARVYFEVTIGAQKLVKIKFCGRSQIDSRNRPFVSRQIVFRLPTPKSWPKRHLNIAIKIDVVQREKRNWQCKNHDRHK